SISLTACDASELFCASAPAPYKASATPAATAERPADLQTILPFDIRNSPLLQRCSCRMDHAATFLTVQPIVDQEKRPARLQPIQEELTAEPIAGKQGRPRQRTPVCAVYPHRSRRFAA